MSNDDPRSGYVTVAELARLLHWDGQERQLRTRLHAEHPARPGLLIRSSASPRAPFLVSLALAREIWPRSISEADMKDGDEARLYVSLAELKTHLLRTLRLLG